MYVWTHRNYNSIPIPTQVQPRQKSHHWVGDLSIKVYPQIEKLFPINIYEEREYLIFFQHDDTGDIKYTPGKASSLEAVKQHKSDSGFLCTFLFVMG